jgi:hypothetical protein
MTARTRELRERSTPRRGLSRLEAAVYVGVGITKFDELVKTKRMPAPKVVDGAQVWDMLALDSYFEALPSVEPPPEAANYYTDH